MTNLFMYYAFDTWMDRAYLGVMFERYCDDVVVHCRSKAQADAVLDAIGVRMEQVGLQLHPDKTRVVYCKDSNRKGNAEFQQFTVLGYTFRPRLAKGAKNGAFFVSFSPAVSRDAQTRIRNTIRDWRIHRRSDLTFAEIVAHINRYVAGWIAYYGRFYKSALYVALRGINNYLMRLAKRKFKHLRRSRQAGAAGPWSHL